MRYELRRKGSGKKKKALEMNAINPDKSWQTALWLAAITVFYNIGEGAVSIFLGASDESLSLFGFGLDSFVEVISGLGIWHMVARVRKNVGQKDSFEKLALKITGFSFYLLTFGLIVTAFVNIYNRSQPSTTFWGIVISLVSIATMLALMTAKMRVGRKLGSDAIIEDAKCTRTCVYLSIVLLLSSILFEILKIGYIDSIGALGIAFYAFMEGRESIEKSKGTITGD
jgi:divalent metal cation (Fe/Co/Zn/Cd) transporter